MKPAELRDLYMDQWRQWFAPYPDTSSDRDYWLVRYRRARGLWWTNRQSWKPSKWRRRLMVMGALYYRRLVYA